LRRLPGWYPVGALPFARRWSIQDRRHPAFICGIHLVHLRHSSGALVRGTIDAQRAPAHRVDAGYIAGAYWRLCMHWRFLPIRNRFRHGSLLRASASILIFTPALTPFQGPL
jgi:hypothetical protein